MFTMPKSHLNLPPLKLTTEESFGQRLARIRKERGLTQVQLADKIGLTQALVTSYERNRLRMHSEMIARFALALGVSADDLIGLPSKRKSSAQKVTKLSLKIIRRLQRIEVLPGPQQKALLRSIDMLLGGAGQHSS